MDTLEYNELENLCLLLPEQDQLVLRGKYSCEEGWQQLDMELSLPTADTPVLTDTYDGVQVQLEETQGTITLSPAPKTDQWGDIGIRVEQEHSYPILGAYNEYVDVCIGEQEDGFFHPVVYSQGWCFDFAAGHKLSVTELLMCMGLDPDETQLAVYRAAIQTFDRNMVQQEYYDSLRESGMLSGMRADTLRDNGLEDLTVLLKNENTVTLVAGYHTTAGSGWRPLEVEFPLTPAAPAKTPVLTDTYGSVSVLLDGDTRTVTIKRTPETIAWAEDYDIRLDGDVTLPIRNAYNNYVDVCIGELGASFHPVVYLLTEDGFVEYVDVLRCLLYGQSLLCADPIYIANNGTALALRDAEVSLLCADGTETELAPLTAEWNSPQQVDSTGSFTLGEGENLCWLDLNSGGGCQLATHNNRYFYQGAVTYLGATPDGTALGFSLIRDTENGPEWVAFSAALKLDL